MKKSLAVYFTFLVVLCTAIIAGAKMLGQHGAYLAQTYMLTPAIAAVLTRLFFYKPRFQDANLRFGRFTDYIKFWALSIGIIALWHIALTLQGSISWDLTGNVFLEKLTQQFAATGQDINATLPPSLTPQMMLVIFSVGGLTIFNIFPGIITGFGEEFGHRGFMFPVLYRIKPWAGLVVGGLLWYAWHLPLTLVIPETTEFPLWQAALNLAVSAIGAIFTFIYLAYIYIKSKSVFVTSIAHIAMNNAAASFSYFTVIRDQALANLGLILIMMIVVAILYLSKELDIFARYFHHE